MGVEAILHFEHHQLNAVYFNHIREKEVISKASTSNTLTLKLEKSRWTNSTTGIRETLYLKTFRGYK